MASEASVQPVPAATRVTDVIAAAVASVRAVAAATIGAFFLRFEGGNVSAWLEIALCCICCKSSNGLDSAASG